MSVRIMAMVFEAKIPDTQVGENNVSQATMKSVLLALADHANDEGKSIYPAIQRLEVMTGLKDRTIQRAEAALVALGILKHVGFSEYGTKNYSIIPAVLSSMKYQKGGDVESPGDSEYKKRVSESPKPSIKPSIESYIGDAVIIHMQSIGMHPNSNTLTILSDWRKNHTDEWIIKALDMSKGKNQNYADKILLGWEAEGYPKSREEQRQERKSSNVKTATTQQPAPAAQRTPEQLERERAEYRAWKAEQQARASV